MLKPLSCGLVLSHGFGGDQRQAGPQVWATSHPSSGCHPSHPQAAKEGGRRGGKAGTCGSVSGPCLGREPMSLLAGGTPVAPWAAGSAPCSPSRGLRVSVPLTAKTGISLPFHEVKEQVFHPPGAFRAGETLFVGHPVRWRTLSTPSLCSQALRNISPLLPDL